MGFEIFKMMGVIAINKEKALKDIQAVKQGAQKASTAMGKSFQKFSGYVAKHSDQIKKAGKYMTVFGGIATAAFALSVKSAAAFEEQLANVSTMLDESAMKILPEYRNELQRLSVDFGESTQTLSKGLYDILSASIPPAEALDVLEISATAAAAGITDTGVAADAITTILNSYGMSADQAGSVSDKLFAIVKGGKTTFAELAPAIGKVAATASMAGLDFDDLGASISTLTRAGIRTDEAMTSINGVLRAFLGPTEEAAKMAKDVFGFALDTTTLKALGMTGVMEKLTDATAEQLAVMFPNIRGLKGIAAALGDAEGYARDYALMLNSAGLTQEAFEKQSNTLNFALKQLKSMFEVIKVTIGDALVPAIKDLVKRGMEILKRVKEWTEANKPLTETIVKWAAGLSVALLVLGPLLIILPGLIASLGLLKIAFVPFLVGGLIIAGLIKMSELFGDIKKRAFEVATGFKEWPLDVLITKISEMKDTIAGLEAELEEVDKPFKILGIEIQKQDVNIDRLKQSIKDWKIELSWLEEELKILIETLGITGTGIKQVDEFAQSFADKMLMMEIAAKSFVVANKNLRTFMEPVRKIIEGITAALTPYEQKIIAVNTKYDEMIETIKESGAAQEEITAAVEDANIARDETLKLLADEKTAYDKLVEVQKTAKNIMAGIVDKIFEFTRSPYEVKLRNINKEYDGYIEKIKEAKYEIGEEKEKIDEINHARELAIQGLNAEVDATKGLSLEMQILTAEYKLATTGLTDYDEIQKLTLEYYQDMLEAAKEIVEVKKAERDALEEGTIEWKEANLAYLEARLRVEDLEGTIKELNQVMNEELEGLELIRAKLDLQSKQYEVTGKDADYYKERIELLGEEHGELAEAIAELEERGEEWSGELVKLKGELAGNETATEKLKEELIELAGGMSDVELEASGLIPILEALGITMEDLKPPDTDPWEDFFDRLKGDALTTTEILVDAAWKIWEAFKDALSGVVHSLLTMAETNAKIKEEMAEAEAEHLKELAELYEDYDEMIAENLEERAEAEKDYHDEITEAEKDHLEEVTELQEDYQQMIIDGLEELAREKEDYYDDLEALELSYNRKMSDGIKDLARENEDYDIEMRRLKEQYYIAVLEGDDKTAKKYKENMEDCTLAHERAVEDMEEKQGELTEDHGIKMDKMEENHKNAMDEMIKKQGEEAQNALDKIAEVEADHEKLIAKMEEEHKDAMDAMIEKHDEEAANALENIEDIKEDHADLMEGMEDDLVTTQSIAETFWETLKKAAIDALTDMIVKQVISAFISYCASIPLGWLVFIAGIAAAVALAYSLAAKEFGGEVMKQTMALGGRVAKFAGGGLMKGLQLGGRGTDTVPAMLTPGEYVISRPMTDFIKRTGIVTDDLVNAIRVGAKTPTPSFAVGGAVPSIVSNPISNQVNIEEISVSIFAQELNDETISNAGDKMFVELKRQFDMRGLVLMEG